MEVSFLIGAYREVFSPQDSNDLRAIRAINQSEEDTTENFKIEEYVEPTKLTLIRKIRTYSKKDTNNR